MLSGLRKGDRHPAYTLVSSMVPSTFYRFMSTVLLKSSVTSTTNNPKVGQRIVGLLWHIHGYGRHFPNKIVTVWCRVTQWLQLFNIAIAQSSLMVTFIVGRICTTVETFTLRVKSAILKIYNISGCNSDQIYRVLYEFAFWCHFLTHVA